MPPILASVINSFPDYCHDHLVFMTAGPQKKMRVYAVKHKISSIKMRGLILRVSGRLSNVCKKCSMRTPWFIAGSIKNLVDRIEINKSNLDFAK
jgi:hypothetical protein